MSIKDFAKALAPQATALGDMGIEALAKELEEQAEKADAPWKKSILNLLGDSIGKYGPEGLRMAQKGLEDLLEGKRGTKISDLTDDIETATDLLAALQNAEADRKTAARKFLMGVGQTLGTISKGFLKALL